MTKRKIDPAIDPRVKKTYELLFEAFKELLQVKHYQFIKVQDITKKAQINRATFYNHFENLPDFIIFCAREGFRRDVIRKYQNEKFRYSKENLHELVMSILTFMSQEYSLWHYRWDEILFEKALRIELYHFLSEWLIDFKNYSGDVLFGNIPALAVSSSIIGLGLEWCSEGCGVSIDELTEKITDFFYSGLQMKKESDQLIRLVKISNET